MSSPSGVLKSTRQPSRLVAVMKRSTASCSGPLPACPVPFAASAVQDLIAKIIAVQQRLRLALVGRIEQHVEVGLVAPQRQKLPDVALIDKSVGKKRPVEPPRRRASDHIDHNPANALSQRSISVVADEPKQLQGDAALIDGERDAARKRKSDAGFFNVFQRRKACGHDSLGQEMGKKNALRVSSWCTRLPADGQRWWAL